MKILYMAYHPVLEYDEVKLLTELGHDVFSVGVYSHPDGNHEATRPGILGMKYYPEFQESSKQIKWAPDPAIRHIITDDLIEWCDTIIYMHAPEHIALNWARIKHKRVIFRSIGQNGAVRENFVGHLVREGMQVIRYSPKERNIPEFGGEDTVIRFYKDPAEFHGWNGINSQAIVLSSTLKIRGEHCFYDEIQYLLKGFPNKIYGINNEDLGEQWGGVLSPDGVQSVLRDNRCFVYGGTWPANYTLGFIEAMMTGIPVVSIGSNIANNRFEGFDYYEIPDLIENNVDGFVSDDMDELRDKVRLMLNDHDYAKYISNNAQAKAKKLFDKIHIAQQWKNFLG